MPPVNSPVVDACIIFKASDNSDTEESMLAYKCLFAIEENEIDLIISKALKEEWNRRNTSLYALKWLSSLYNSGRYREVDISGLETFFRVEIDKYVPESYVKIRAAMKKDLHLFCAAIRGDYIIISCNQQEALKYKKYLSHDERIAVINWCNPDNLGDLTAWIASGLPHEDAYQIINID